MACTRLLCGVALALVALGCGEKAEPKEEASGTTPEASQAKEPSLEPVNEPANEPAQPSEEAPSLQEQELAAFEAAKPVFEEHCAHCHTSDDGKSKKRKKMLKHFKMDSYPFEGHHAHELGAIVRKVLGVDGGKATMPEDDKGAVQGEELELIVAWSRAFDAAHQDAKGGHEHKEKGHSH